ncbi:MAG: hypothetical protein NT062_14710 [Proteobacteria bacterium]|nr:hypothetical protein [Pseudomonadota bacterium]
MKNGRFSAKNSSFALRLTCEGSASTWPKSGFRVADSVKAGPSPYFMSRPRLPRPPTRALIGSPASIGMTAKPPVRYGRSSSRRAGRNPVIPSTVPNFDTIALPLVGHGDHVLCSVVRPTMRRTCMPHSCEFPLGYRSWDSGIRNSAVHPVGVIAASPVHTASQLSSRF